VNERASLKVPPSVSKQPSYDPLNLSSDTIIKPSSAMWSSAATIPATTALFASPEVASATTSFAPNAVPSALAAYGHYISLLGIVACIMIERLTIKPNMSDDEEDVVAIADTCLGLWGALIAYTGYLRVAQYEKGIDFYFHEPIFWLKIALVGVFGAASFFNTTKIIQRAVAKRNGTMEPMGEKLSARMIQICNAELVALATIPITATFMARGVAYSDSIPWQGEAGLAAAVFAGLSFKYIKEALTFEDDPAPVVVVVAAVEDNSEDKGFLGGLFK
jgi:putative membrane protein